MTACMIIVRIFISITFINQSLFGFPHVQSVPDGGCHRIVVTGLIHLRAVELTAADFTNALVGIQPTFKQVPPIHSLSTNVTFKPCFFAYIAAT